PISNSLYQNRYKWQIGLVFRRFAEPNICIESCRHLDHVRARLAEKSSDSHFPGSYRIRPYRMGLLAKFLGQQLRQATTLCCACWEGVPARRRISDGACAWNCRVGILHTST